jgi:hypothetical protein
MHWIRSHLSFANAVSLIALFIALGGASYAAVSLPKNSVGAKQIKKNGVGASEIKRNAVGASEIKSNAVAGGDVRDGALTGADLGDGSVSGSDVGDGSLNAFDIADGSIAAADLADNSVGSSKIVDGSVTAGDLHPGAGGPTAFARVQADGTLEPGSATGSGPPQFKGVDATDIQKAATGTYCFGGLDFNIAAAVVAMDNAGAAATTTEVASVAIQRGANLGGCDAGHQQARVVITNVDPALAAAAAVDGRFTVWFMGG